MSRFLKKFFRISKIINNDEKKDEIKDSSPKDLEMKMEMDMDMRKEIQLMGENEAGKKNVCKLFVGGLSFSTTDEDFKAYFSEFGKVVDVFIPKFKASGRHRGFGFVTFDSSKDAKAALEEKFHYLGGKTVEVVAFIKKKENPSNCQEKSYENRVFMGGLAEDQTEKDLKEFFSKYGEVNVFICRERLTKKSKGFGFLSFKNKISAETCLADRLVFLNGRRIILRKAISSFKTKNDVICSCSDGIVEDEDNNYDDDGSNKVASVSGEKVFPVEESSAFRNLFETHFLAPFFDSDARKENNLEEENKASTSGENIEKVADVEKLISNFLISEKSVDGASDQDLMEFSSESEMDSQSYGNVNVHDDNPGRDGSGDYTVSDHFEKGPKTLSKNLASEIKSSSSLPTENLSFNESTHKNEFSRIQKSLPMQSKNKNEFLMCYLCQWISADGNMDSFLAHCKTSAHRGKLKERFLTEPKVDDLKQLLAQANSQKLKEKSECNSVPTSGSTLVGKKNLVGIKNDNERKNNKKREESRIGSKKKIKNDALNQKKRCTAGGHDEKQDVLKNKAMSELKYGPLFNHLTGIQALSENELKCQVCNWKVPNSSNADILTKKLRSHLQSKVHLEKLLRMENSLSSNNSSDTAAVPSAIPAPAPAPAPSPENLNKTRNKKTQKAKEKVHRIPLITNPHPKETQIYKKQGSESPESAADIMFICLPCNLICQSTEVFSVHLGLDSHLKKNIEARDSLSNMSKCKSCQAYLYGSIQDVNEHYSKCKK